MNNRAMCNVLIRCPLHVLLRKYKNFFLKGGKRERRREREEEEREEIKRKVLGHLPGSVCGPGD